MRISAWQVKTPLILLLVLCAALRVAAQDSMVIGGLDGRDPYDTTRHYPVLLALSGGGARGLAAIGVLRAFEEKHIVPAAIAGTSIGGIVGGLYVCGYSPDQLTGIIRGTDFSELFANRPSRLTMFLTQRQEDDRHLLSVRFDGFRPTIPQALTAGQQVSSTLSALTSRAVYRADRDFSHLKIPFKTVTTDIVSGKMAVLSSGSLADAMRATMAYPLAFTGLERDSQLLMDGGMLSPVPVDVVSGMSSATSFVVAVNTTSPLVPRDRLVSPIDIAGQVTSIMTRDKLLTELAHADYVIAPLPDSITSTDFALRDSIINIGYHAGLSAADSIITLTKSQAHDRSYLIRKVVCDRCDPSLISRLSGERFTRHALMRLLSQEVIDRSLYRMTARLQALDSDAAQTPDTSAVMLVIHAEPAITTDRLRISFRGVSLYPESTLIRHMDLPQGLLTAPALRRGLDRIVNLYSIDGYDLADVRSAVIDTADQSLTITIDEAIVRSIVVENKGKARDWLIRSYCPLKVGRPYSTSVASRGVSNIYGTDLFEQVSIEPIPIREGVAAVVSVREKKSAQVRLGWHWDDEYQSEEFAEFLNDDVMGAGIEYLFHAQYGYDHQLYSAELKANRIFSTYLTARLQLFHDRFDRKLFRTSDHPVSERVETTDGIGLMVGQQIERLGTASARLKLRNLTSRDPQTDIREKLRLRQLIFETHVETFDRWPFPRSGKRHFFEIALTGKYLGGNVEFTRFFSSLESYFPFGDWLCYHPTASIGLSRSGLPISEQFYFGGLRSFAGLRTNQVAGDKMLLLNQELRVKLPLRLYFFTRVDIGEAYATAEQIKLRNLRTGFGVSLAFDSPIGPVEFGYGITNHNADRFYFSAGPSF
ncbi:hypothetical protein C3F09_11300 [candidate division GN15 bacterium]|uniref:PNPLA domain-containing protein n=1 Tax=candidate division GN15 bacterium TaxID=2072418 RepID=A0A855X2Z2_9BACT|nr:MAG: hypothetical protein C3F09_11300 [candidate division GN15 bacterium]